MMKNVRFLLGFLFLFLRYSGIAQHENILTVRADKSISSIPTTLWGVFFEDINFGADGGIYAELVKNRSFEFTRPLMGWEVKGKKLREGDALVMNRAQENKANQRYLKLMVHDAKENDLILVNEGFRGMGIEKDIRYSFSMMYRLDSPGLKMHIGLIDSSGNKLCEYAEIIPKQTNGKWLKDSVSFVATTTQLKAKMVIWYEGSGIIDLDMISLFPSNTWKNRPGGMRTDMIQRLADLKPGFVRFPGGCIVEGFDLAHRYQWKNTIGPIEERQLNINRWSNEMAKRPAPDYFQTFGLGFFEYFLLAEDIGAEPLPILNCGMACQFNSAEVASINELDPYIQDALDLIEFANGDSNTKWGKIRAAMGHPDPYHLKMMGIGNENWGPQYIERLGLFTRSIHSKYPQFKIVTSSGTDPDGERFEYLNGELRKIDADIIDEHYYRKPEWFLANAKRYDNYPRNGPKIFCGEYAAQSDRTGSLENQNNWVTALSEAAFMTGLERNAAVVQMASYAPLFAHVDGWQWRPDLIWVNNLRSYGTPDYYVQQLFSQNKGSEVVSITLNNKSVAGQDSLFATACTDSLSKELIIKIVNASEQDQPISLLIDGVKRLSPLVKLITLQNNDLDAKNSFDQPLNISPKESSIEIKNKTLKYRLMPYSLSILKFKMVEH